MGSSRTPSEKAEEKPSRAAPLLSLPTSSRGTLASPPEGSQRDTSPCSSLPAPGPADPNQRPESPPAAARPPPGRGHRMSPTAGSCPEEGRRSRSSAGSRARPGAPHLPPPPPPPPLAAPRPRWRRRPPSPRAPPRTAETPRARPARAPPLRMRVR